MQIPVWVEPKPESGFRAISSLPFALTADGLTEAEALSRLQELIHDRLDRGGRFVTLEAPEATEAERPWMRFAGDLKEEPQFDVWQEAIQEYRRERDEAAIWRISSAFPS
jgi:hypothetical protein